MLGFPTKANRSADKGNICHKALEMLGLWKKYTQLGATSYDDDTFGTIQLDDITPSKSIQMAFDYYQKNSIHNFNLADFKDCEQWMHMALNYKGGVYDPRLRNVINAEQVFDIEIDEPWAKYNYRLPDGKDLVGNLRLKGTIDLITKLDDGVLEVIDWKTGKYRKDWATDEEKTYKYLQNDSQLRLYHYAVSKLMPEHKNLIITIYYINAGGPFSLCFHENDLEKSKNMIRKKFERIKTCQIPKLNITWKCNRFCSFSEKYKDTNKTICQHIKDEVRLKGIDKTTQLYCIDNAYMKYGDGGGRKAT